jgi:CBS domain containing-hemolysin-like protein
MSTVEDHENIDSEIQIFQNALEFSGVKARDIMTPRTEISAVEIHDTLNDLKEKFINTGYSKILVYQNSLDDILGYVHSFELFKKPRSIKSVLIPVEFVPETIFIKDVLDLLTKKRKSVAIVLDEYGGTSGMITVEDIVEELFGEIEDEHDVEELIEQKIEDNTFRFSANAYNQLHNDSLNLVRTETENNSEEKLAVFTHHCPTFLNYPEQYKGDILNEAFATELYDLIETSNISSWVYGHHHTNTPAFTIGNTK